MKQILFTLLIISSSIAMGETISIEVTSSKIGQYDKDDSNELYLSAELSAESLTHIIPARKTPDIVAIPGQTGVIIPGVEIAEREFLMGHRELPEISWEQEAFTDLEPAAGSLKSSTQIDLTKYREDISREENHLAQDVKLRLTLRLYEDDVISLDDKIFGGYISLKKGTRYFDFSAGRTEVRVKVSID